MARRPEDKLLLTPGPVSVSRHHQAGHAARSARPATSSSATTSRWRGPIWWSWSTAGDEYAAIPLPGSATYANEAAIAALVPQGGTLLVHSNGVYGDRLLEICEALGTAVHVVRTEPFVPVTPDLLRGRARRRPGDHPRDRSCTARPARG